MDKLTQRETEVLKLITMGFDNTEISRKMYISTHTVKAHIEHIYSKLGVHNRLQAVIKYLKQKSARKSNQNKKM